MAMATALAAGARNVEVAVSHLMKCLKDADCRVRKGAADARGGPWDLRRAVLELARIDADVMRLLRPLRCWAQMSSGCGPGLRGATLAIEGVQG